MKRSIYLASPMSGMKHHNADALLAFQRVWRRMGWDAITPLEANNRVWLRHHGVSYDPYTMTVDYGHPILPEMFAEDLATLCSADAIGLLPGWDKSEGVSRELAIATLLKKPVFDALTGEELDVGCQIIFTVVTPNYATIIENKHSKAVLV